MQSCQFNSCHSTVFTKINQSVTFVDGRSQLWQFIGVDELAKDVLAAQILRGEATSQHFNTSGGPEPITQQLHDANERFKMNKDEKEVMNLADYDRIRLVQEMRSPAWSQNQQPGCTERQYVYAVCFPS